jgi:uncharacterized membrane protein
MWFVGGLVGLLLGAMLGAAWFSWVPAIGLAIAAQKLYGRLARRKAQPAEALASAPDAIGAAPNLAELSKRVMALEGRIVLLEQMLEAKAGPASVPLLTPISPQEAIPSVQLQAFKPVIGPAPVVAVPSVPVAAHETQLTLEPMPTIQATARTVDNIVRTQVEVPAEPSFTEAPDTVPVPLEISTARGKRLADTLATRVKTLIFGGNTLVKAGVLILFLGLAFLLRYTADRITVPVELRYAAVALAGIGLLVVGWLLRRKRAEYALIVQGAGIGVLYLTVLAAMKFHSLIPAWAGFTLLFAVAVLSAALAVLQNASILATVAAFEGFAAPVLSSTGGNYPVALFTYLAVLDISIFLVARFKAWRLQNLIGFVGTFTLAVGWAEKHYSDAQYTIVQPFLIFFFLLFTLVGLLFAWRTMADLSQQPAPDGLAARAGQALDVVGRVDSALVFGTPVTAFGLQYLLMRPWHDGAAWSALAFAAFYLVLARLVYAKQRHGLALLGEAYAIVAAIFVTLAIPLGLEGTWSGAAWAIEGAGMYWLGVRQQRPYARWLAYGVLAGSGYKLLQEIWINSSEPGPVLGGSSFGPVLLAVAAFTMWALHRRLGAHGSREAVAGRFLPWVAVAALTLVPWQWLLPSQAATACALLALALFAVSARWSLRPLMAIASTQQALSVGAFLVTLQKGTGPQPEDAALANGAQGLVEMALIGLSLLTTAGWTLWNTRRNAVARGLPPNWSRTSSVTAIAGVLLLHLTPLFANSVKDTVQWWPLSACVVLWVALYMSHAMLAATAAALQTAAAGVFLGYLLPAPMTSPMLAHQVFLMPMLFAGTWLVSGDWIRAQAWRHAQAQTGDGSANIWLNPWCDRAYARWLPVLGALGFWLAGWLLETERLLTREAALPYRTAVDVLLVIATSVLASTVARWRNWREPGLCTAVTVPSLMLVAGLALVHSGVPYLPSQGAGWLAWPLALVWHLVLLRWLQPRWLSTTYQGLLHVLGFWLLLFLAARECGLRMTPIDEPFSSWKALGWLLVPALTVCLLCTRLAGRWPMAAFRTAYLGRAFPPVIAIMLLWVTAANVVLPGNARPLPYLPMLNPLELGFALVLGSVMVWRRSVPIQVGFLPSANTMKIGMALFALFLLTGTVLRSCHHWAGVPWDFTALMASRLAQAALSITWAVCGVLVMVLANRGTSRGVWIGGAALLGVVVLKLFFVELADKGGLYRIISFMVVGVLLLLVGYFAPVPPKSAGKPQEAMA